MKVIGSKKIFFVLGALWLAACTPDDDKNKTPAAADSEPYYLFFGDGINAIDPAAPISPITVEADPDIEHQLFFAGTYTPATKTFSDVHNNAILYSKPNGKLYKVSALKKTAVPYRYKFPLKPPRG